MQTQFGPVSKDIDPTPLAAATDPVGGVHDSVPISPDSNHPGPRDLWQEHIRKKRPPQKRPPDRRKNVPPASDHQIDEYV